MTVPAHTNTTTAAEVLAAHTWMAWSEDAGMWRCEDCGLGVPGVGGSTDALAQHQAEALAAAGLLADPTTWTEWGVRCGDAEADVIEADDRKDAERIKAHHDAVIDHTHTIVRRTVTDWTPAEENEHG